MPNSSSLKPNKLIELTFFKSIIRWIIRQLEDRAIEKKDIKKPKKQISSPVTHSTKIRDIIIMDDNGNYALYRCLNEIII